MFDEPVNGLDPEGVRWIRHLMRSLAAEGRTVLLSSHLMSEMELTADRLVIIGRGGWSPRPRSGTCRPPRPGGAGATPARRRAHRVLEAAGATVARSRAGGLVVRRLDIRGDRGPGRGRRPRRARGHPARRLAGEAYMELTGDSAEYRAGGR
ncbi:hypothetical protein [Streptosporangium vulgare]|uniref:hypothetical protein n=1 Tax=Streptosporangium vulgare TaxID=46190 RepID=UPI0031D81A46